MDESRTTNPKPRQVKRSDFLADPVRYSDESLDGPIEVVDDETGDVRMTLARPYVNEQGEVELG